MIFYKYVKELRELTVDKFNELMKTESGWYLMSIVHNPTEETKILVGYAPEYTPIVY